MDYSGPSLESGAMSISEEEALEVEWIRNARQQSQYLTSIVLQRDELKTARDTLQAKLDMVKDYGWRFETNTNLTEAIDKIDQIITKLNNLSNCRLDTKINQFNNNIEYARRKKLTNIINEKIRDYNTTAREKQDTFIYEWYNRNDPYEDETQEQYHYRCQSAKSSYMNTYYRYYEITECDGSERTLQDLQNCSSLRTINNAGAGISFEVRPSDAAASN